MDLIIRNANLPDGAWPGGKGPADIAIDGERIVKIAPAIPEKGKQEIDATGKLVSAPLCDPHLHLDAVLTVGKPRYNESGTLLEGIRIWGERKPHLMKRELVENAKEAVLWEFANGVQFIRTHADTTDPTLLTVEALLEVRESMKDLVDIQVTAFPQDAVYTAPNGESLMRRAMDMGCDVVGGAPHIEYTREDGVKQVEFAFALAEEYGALIDIHCDETGDEQSRFVEVMLKLAMETGFRERVTVSHATAMHNYNNDYAFKLVGIAAKSGVNFITNPYDNSVLQNRTEGYPRRRGHTRVDELDANGVNVSIGHDSIMDPWYPMGTGNMLHAANLLLHYAHMSGYAQIPRLFKMVTGNSARTLQVEERYGLAEGKPANLIILDAPDEFEAVRLMPVCLYSIRKGKVALVSRPAERRLAFANYDRAVDFRV
ncbi:MAG: amidohydrolase family protein [Deltaproteobacteria bacterium]|nr:amidohydrolase family protein [Deltaproteobacteria bacterium]